MSDAKINDVSDTALWVGVYRDQETRKPNGLFKDPLAAKLVGDRARAIEKSMSYSKYVYHSVVIRTCIIDSFLQKLISEAGADTVLNLGCGIDTRPYRMNLPAHLKWIEVDFPHMIQMKEEMLAGEKPHCQLERVPLDLSNISERQNLFTRINSESKKVIVLTEGVTPYLNEDAVGSLADDLWKQNHFRYWITDYNSRKLMEYMKKSKRRRKEMKNAPFLFDPLNWWDFYKTHGWKEKEMRYLGHEGDKLGRPFPLPPVFKLIRFLMGKGRDESFKKMSGYAIMEPVR